LGYIAQIVAVDPGQLRDHFRKLGSAALRQAAAQMLDNQGLDDDGLTPDAVVDALLGALGQEFDTPTRIADVNSPCLYLIIDALVHHWDPCYSETWNGYDDALGALTKVMPKWGGLLQTSLSRGLYGLMADEWPGCGWISPNEIRHVVPSFTDNRRDGYLKALQSHHQRDWYAVKDDLERCATDGRWIIHSYG
jgi:hypothetical protein